MHVNNPSLTVSHVVSLTVPTKTAPVGSNPFEDEEEEEEAEEEEEKMVVEQQPTVNHISVNKEEKKMLVNRRKLRPPTTSPAFSVFYLCWTASRLSIFHGSPRLLPFLYLNALLLRNPLSSLRWQVIVLLCMVTEMALHTKPNVCLSFTPNSAMSR